jgi:mono/diheme cytochrome c family protein
VTRRALWLCGLLVAACREEPPAPAATSASATAATSATAAASVDPEASATLQFYVRDKPLRGLTKRDLLAHIPRETIVTRDPYYGDKKKRFAALPIARVLARGFEGANLALEEQHFVLRASDGYTVPIDGAQLIDDDAFLAVADLDVPGWEPVGAQQVSPGPYYLVWRGDDKKDTSAYPRPYQLVAIAVTSFEESFPHTTPEGAPEAAQRGFALFRSQCIRCHAINRSGGRVGPDLNVPQSIVEYRPEEQIRTYIKNPFAFRYGNMPANPHLGDADLDDLLAYLRAMSQHKHDPGHDGQH